MTLYFQEQFLKLKCTENAKSTIKNALKSERKKKLLSLKKNITKDKKKKKRKKMQRAKQRYYRDPESRQQYQKRKYQENTLKKLKICINTLDLFDLVLPIFFIFIFLISFCFWRVFF